MPLSRLAIYKPFSYRLSFRTQSTINIITSFLRFNTFRSIFERCAGTTLFHSYSFLHTKTYLSTIPPSKSHHALLSHHYLPWCPRRQCYCRTSCHFRWFYPSESRQKTSSDPRKALHRLPRWSPDFRRSLWRERALWHRWHSLQWIRPVQERRLLRGSILPSAESPMSLCTSRARTVWMWHISFMSISQMKARVNLYGLYFLRAREIL